MSPSQLSRRSQLPPPNKDQQLNNYLWTKIDLRELGSPLKKLQQHSGTKHLLRITTRTRGRKNSFIFPVSSHSLGLHYRAPRGNSWAQNSASHQESGNKVSDWLLQTSLSCKRVIQDPLSSHFTQSLTKLRYLESESELFATSWTL